MDEDGYFTIVDRKTDMILTAGYNVYPAELERVLCMHTAVALAAVTGVPDEAKGELAKAYVVLKPEATVTKEELTAHCRKHLAAHKIPRADEPPAPRARPATVHSNWPYLAIRPWALHVTYCL